MKSKCFQLNVVRIALLCVCVCVYVTERGREREMEGQERVCEIDKLSEYVCVRKRKREEKGER